MGFAYASARHGNNHSEGKFRRPFSYATLLCYTACMSAKRESLPIKAGMVETFDDVAERLAATNDVALRFWSPMDAASTHGVLWFAELQRQVTAAFPDRKALIVLDCGDRGDLAHAAMCEGLRVICFRGSPVMLDKLRSIAGQLGATIETQHPSLMKSDSD